jgi:AP-4 complex subunit sigma-1
MQAHFILDEMVSNGFVVETSKAAVLVPVELLDKAT